MSTTDKLLRDKIAFRMGLHPRCPAKAASEAVPHARLSIKGILGPTGDAHVVGNTGGVVRDDALRLLVISRRLPQARERSCSSTTPTATC